ncbi:MAG: RraA family protein [Acidobacteriia bacterium]|nr:RraA family protein [Terriglobia bacterium]
MDTGASDFVARLKRLDCCAVSDALDKLRLTGVAVGLSQLAGTQRIAGRVLTVKLGVGALPAGPLRHLGTTAIQAAQPGDIIVVEQRSGVYSGCWGGILSLGAKLRGVGGVIADGLVRDIDEARQHEFPIFARDVTPVTARGRVVELSNNQPVKIADIEVKAGDYAIADGSGVVFISAENVEAVLAAAEGIAAVEAAMTKALVGGQAITEVMGANYEHLLRK